MKIAVTGASGFVGRYVLTELTNCSVDTIAVTRTPENFEGASKCSRGVKWDLEWSTDECYETLGRPDVLIHLAWDGLPNYKSLHHFEEELPKQYAFLKAMVDGGLPSLLVTGTCFEYGMQEGCLFETTQTVPTNPYGFAKDALRRQLEFLQGTKEFDLTWARLFYMYGEHQPKSSIYPQLRDAVLRGDRIFNMSGGEQLRDYLPIEKIAQSLVRLAMKKAGSGVVNVCSGQAVSIGVLVEKWIKDNGWDIGLNRGYYPYPDHEPMAFWGDDSKLKSVLNN